MREGYVGNRGVEDFHEGGEGDCESDEPGIVAGAPGGDVEGLVCGYGGSGHEAPLLVFLLVWMTYYIHACMYLVKR